MNQSADDKPEIHSFRLDELSPATYNPRTISDESMEGLRNSIQRFNCVQLIIVNIREEKNVIVGGHQRYRALMDLKGDDWKVDCVTVDLDDDEERLLNIALNNPEIQGEFDIGKLAESVKEIRERMPDDSGLVDMRIDKLIQDIKDEGVVGLGNQPEIEFTVELREQNNYLVFVFDDVLDWQVIREQFELGTVAALDSRADYERKWGERIVRFKGNDTNPIIRVPIGGI